MNYLSRILTILEDDRFTAEQNVTIAIKYTKELIKDLQQRRNDFKKAEEHKTSKDFYKQHLYNLINQLLAGG